MIITDTAIATQNGSQSNGAGPTFTMNLAWTITFEKAKCYKKIETVTVLTPITVYERSRKILLQSSTNSEQMLISSHRYVVLPPVWCL